MLMLKMQFQLWNNFSLEDIRLQMCYLQAHDLALLRIQRSKNFKGYNNAHEE